MFLCYTKQTERIEVIYGKKDFRFENRTGVSGKTRAFERGGKTFRRTADGMDHWWGSRHSRVQCDHSVRGQSPFHPWGHIKNDLLVLAGRLTHVGTTSMEVRVDTYVETLDGIRRPINRAYLTLVAVDKDGSPTKVPSVILETESEKAEWEAGKRRRELRVRKKKRRILEKLHKNSCMKLC